MTLDTKELGMEKENILGVDVCITSKAGLMECVREDIRNGRQKFIVAINPEKIVGARNDKELMDVLNGADYQIPDGVGLLIASRLRRGRIRERITGIDTMETLCAEAAKSGFCVFLYGARPEVVEKAKAVLEERYQGIRIAGFVDGYCTDNGYIVEQINAAGADILFVALGSPKQEYWIAENRENLNVRILQGVGGSFDVVCGHVKRAPACMRRCGLEWLYRLCRQPKRLLRQLKIVKFLFIIGRKNT